MTYEIQQRTLGGILDQSFQLMRDHFVTLSAAMVGLYVPYAVLSDLLVPESARSGQVPDLSTIIPTAILLLALLALMPLAQLVVTKAVADAYLGQPQGLGVTLRAVMGKFAPYLGTFMLVGLASLAAFSCFIIPGLYFMICWMLVGPIAVVEQTFGWQALKRSRELVSGGWWRVLGIMVVSGIVVMALTGVVQLMVSYIPIVGPVLAGVAQGVGATYSSTVLVVLYIDVRCRKEHFDLELMTRQISGAPPPLEPPASDPVAPR